MEDKTIIELFFARDPKAIEVSSQKYGRYCYKIAYNILSNKEDSEECVNDAFLAAWENIPPQNPNILSAYFGKITRNISLKKYRLQTTQKRGGTTKLLPFEELNDCIPEKSGVFDQLDVKEISYIIDDFLRNLVKSERYIFIRRYWYCDSIEDICNSTGFNKGQVKMKLSRIRKKLLLKLGEEGVYEK